MNSGGGARGGVSFGGAADGSSASASATDIDLRGVSLSNTIHSDAAPCLPLPSIPVFCGSFDQDLRLFDGPTRSLNRHDVVSQAGRIAHLLRNTDVSYLNLLDDADFPSESFVDPLELYNEVLRCDSNAFECIITPGSIKEKVGHMVLDRKPFEQEFSATSQAQSDYNGTQSYHHITPNEISPSLRKAKVKKKKPSNISVSATVDPSDLKDSTVEDFCEVLEDFFGKTEIPSEGRDEAEWLTVSPGDFRVLVNEIMSICSKKVLHLVPVDTLVRLLRALDHQVHRAEGLSIDDCEHSDSDGVSTIYSALESVHAALAIMAHNNMPKHLYKEEIIERILEFSRHQMTAVMSACDPSFRALHKPSGLFDGEDDEEGDADFGSASKKRKTFKTARVKKAAASRVSAAVNAIFQKLCTILVLIKDLLLVERLSDSCILQLLKTCFTTFLVDNIHLLQLKAIVLTSGIYYSYAQHRSYIVDETIQLLWKSSVSKRASRAYHLVDEEQRQIQIITALLIQLVHCSTNLPDALRQASNSVAVLEDSFNATYLSKCHDAMQEACALFWSRVLERFASVKNQDASELKPVIENLVMDLLTTLNLPEYPASAPMLEVLCVLLLQNAGLKSKDVSIRSMAIDLLGSIAARLKQDAVHFRSDKYWIIQELVARDDEHHSYPKDLCSICLDGRSEKSLFACQGCYRLFHAHCMGVREDSAPCRGWYCQICLCRKQLLVLQSYCKSQCIGDTKSNRRQSNSAPETPHTISKVEILQQMLMNCLRDTGSADDMHLFALWFYLCLWFKDDPNSQDKFDYYLARLQSKAIVRDSGIVSSLLTRDSAKKLTLALGQNSSFSRGFDKILFMLLASLRESSPVIRAKALRAVSIIVEADPEVLVERGVQSAVEGRFCDSAISVREAALELVGRHIASHPEVGLKYFEKVAERIKDTGVSVRKRAIKIIRDMCTSNANFSEFTSACIEIISRVTDEESSVQDLVCKTFYEFWFEEPSTPQTHFYGDNSSVPLELAKKTEQIVEMLRRMPNHQLLVAIVKRNLALDFFPQSAKASGINPMLISTARKRCELMCKYLLERILQVEEMNNVEGEMRTLPYMLALHAFCVVDPTLCAPPSDPSQFVVTLQPYLKSQADTRVVAQLLESIIFVIDAVLPLVRKLPQAVIEELEKDLKYMIVRHSFLTVVHACIKCLCSVNKVAGKGTSVVEFLIKLFLKRLEALGVDSIENKQQVGRSLFCLGLLIRYGSSLPSTSGKVIDVTESLNLFKHYLLVEDFVIKVRSLQALGFVLIARPGYMLEKDVMNLLEAALSSRADLRLKTQALQNMFEYLVDAETQLGSDKSSSAVQYSAEFDDNDPIGANIVPVAAGAGDTNICGGIVQLYWDNILSRCLDNNEQVRQEALKIVEVVLRQGLVHPITCVPYLIALETDPQEVNSKLSHHLLMNMNEKYPAFFESRLGDGLQMSFNFIQSMNESSCEDSNPRSQSKGTIHTKAKSEGRSFAYARLGVSRIYRLIRSNRVSRNKFMTSVVRKFDSPSWNSTGIPFLVYCSEILALLPFTVPDEPLYMIYAINRVVQVRAGSLEANMKALCLQLSPENTRNIPYQNGIIHSNPLAQNGYNHMASIDLNGPFQQETIDYPSYPSIDTRLHSIPSTSSCDISEDDLQKIKGDCLSATALQLLLKLKRHLKIVYNLNDARCQTFSPNEPLKAGEALSKQSVPFDTSDIRTNTPTTYQDLLQTYQEFKNALKEDTVDYSAYTANIKKKRPTPRKGRKPVCMNGEDDDDDDDDYYTGGGRKVTNSASRVNRQRG